MTFLKNNDSLSSIPDSSLREEVYNRIKQAIIEGKLRSGDRLSEVKLSKLLGTSRTPVREAIYRLGTEGLVNTIPRRGSFVMEIPEDQLTELYLVRGLLEGYGAKRAAHLANDTDIEELEVLTKEYERLVEEGQTNGFDEINEKFHQKILSFCGPIVNRMMKEIRVYTARTQKMALSQDHRPQEVIKEHRALVEAIRNHQAEEADRITRKHMEGGLRAAKKYLES